jgi:hypothetical protein
MSTAFQVILGNADIPSAENLVFGNMEPLTDESIVYAKPDFYDGARPEQIVPQIRQALGKSIIPSTQQHAPALPNFFAEAKGPDGSAAVAKRQAGYNGAIGARGMNAIQKFGPDCGTAQENNAYTITSTYHDGQLKIYTSHSTTFTDPLKRTEYYMTQIRTFAMTDIHGTFRQGAAAFRNARDWAKEKREEAIAAANARVVDMRTKSEPDGVSDCSKLSQSTNRVCAEESDTSADGLDSNINNGSGSATKPRHKRLKS